MKVCVSRYNVWPAGGGLKSSAIATE
jgi:hypothetical protein